MKLLSIKRVSFLVVMLWVSDISASDSEACCWLDRAEARASEEIIALSRRLDRFFGILRDDDPQLYREARALLRLNFEQSRVEGLSLGAGLALRLPLPQLEKRLRLMLDSVDDPAFWYRQHDRRDDPLALDRKRTEIGLEYTPGWVERRRVSLVLSGGPKLSLRYRETWPLSETWQFRARAQLYWKRDRGIGSLVGGDFLRPLGAYELVRFYLQSDEWGDRYGAHWRTGAEWSYQQEPHQGKAALFWFDGVSDPLQVVEYRAAWRVRYNLGRRWFFVELEPSIGRKRPAGQPGADFRLDPSMVVRFEVQLGSPPR